MTYNSNKLSAMLFILFVVLPGNMIAINKIKALPITQLSNLQDTISLDTFSIQNASGIAAITLAKDRLEFNIYNSYVHNQKVYNFFTSPPSVTGDRQHSFNTFLQLTYGLSSKKNWNIGLDLNSTNLFYRPEFFPSENFNLLYGGPRLRWRPFGATSKSVDIVFQNAVYFKLADNKSLLNDDIEISNQVFIFKYLFSKKLILQGAFGFNVRPKSSNSAFDRKTPIVIPASFFIGYFPRRDIILFSFMDYYNELGTMPINFNEGYEIRRSALSLSIGGQITFNYRLSFYLIPQISIYSKNGGGQNQIGFGIRYLY